MTKGLKLIFLKTTASKLSSVPSVTINYLRKQRNLRLRMNRSTNVERTLQKQLFLQNEPKFRRFQAQNGYFAEKQTQNEPKQSQIPKRPKCTYPLMPQRIIQIFGYSSKIKNEPKSNPNLGDIGKTGKAFCSLKYSD